MPPDQWARLKVEELVRRALMAISAEYALLARLLK